MGKSLEFDNIESDSKHVIEMDQVLHSPLNKIQRSRRPSFFLEEGNDIIPVTIIGSDNEEILPDDIAVPPDGGWGWVVVFASFMTSVILGGTIFTFGIVLDAIVESSKATSNSTEISVSTIAATGGCLSACCLFTGPFAAALVNKVGFRLTAIIGSILSSFGFALSWFISRDGILNVPALLVSFGVIGGVGIGLIFITTIVSIGFYFERRRALATGIAVCGTGVGTFAFSPILSASIAKFGWYGTFLVQSGLLLCCAGFAALYRPVDNRNDSLGKRAAESLHDLSQIKKQNGDIIKPSNDDVDVQIISRGSTRTSRGKLQKDFPNDLDEIEEGHESEASLGSIENLRGELDNLQEKPVIRTPMLLQSVGVGYTGPRRSSLIGGMPNVRNRRLSLGLPPPLMNSTSFDNTTGTTQEPKILRVDDKSTFNKPMNRDNIFYRGSIHQIKEFPQNIDLSFASSAWNDEDEETESIPPQPLKTEDKKHNWINKLKEKFYIVRKMLDFSLMKSPTFILVCLMSGMSLFGLLVPFTYLIGLAQEKGCSLDDATLLISIIGISDMAGRIICGGVATKAVNHVVFINNAGLIIGGFATVLIPFCESYSIFVVYACVFGLMNAATNSLRSVIIVELMGLSKLTSAFGLTMFCEGMASLIGTPFIGFLRDSTGNYEVSFIVAGASIIFAGSICSPIHFVKNWENRKEEIEINNDVRDNYNDNVF